MNERFSIKEVFLLPLTFSNSEYVKLDFEYPTRFCVIDNKDKIAIDIQMGLKYDYIETQSKLFILNEYVDKIKENKRVAIGTIKNVSSIDKNLIKLGNNIIKKIENNKPFIDGNEILSNEEYLQIVNNKQKYKAKIKIKTRKKTK